MAIIKGKNLMLFVSDGQGQYASIAEATDHTVDMSSSLIEISTKDSGDGNWTDQEVDKNSWTATSNNLYSRGGKGKEFKDLFAIYASQQPIDVMFSIKADAALPATGWTPGDEPRLKGKALITSLQVNAPDGDNASISITLTGKGALVLDETEG